jgi:phage protein U
MFATFGNITFETLLSPQSLTHKKATDFAEHSRVNNKPKLQKTGEKLDEISLQMKFHVAFCNPSKEIAKLEAIRKSATAESFILGNGEFLGVFVLVSIDKSIEDTFNDGSIMSATLDVVLREYVTNSIVIDLAQTAVKEAFAVSPETPRPIVPTLSIEGNPAKLITSSIASANLAAGKASTELAKAEANPNYLARANSAIIEATQAVSDGLNKAEAVFNTAENLQSMASNLPEAIETARTAAETLVALVPIQSIAEAREATNSLRTGMGSVNVASAPIAVVTSYRGILQ